MLKVQGRIPRSVKNLMVINFTLEIFQFYSFNDFSVLMINLGSFDNLENANLKHFMFFSLKIEKQFDYTYTKILCTAATTFADSPFYRVDCYASSHTTERCRLILLNIKTSTLASRRT